MRLIFLISAAAFVFGEELELSEVEINREYWNKWNLTDGDIRGQANFSRFSAETRKLFAESSSRSAIRNTFVRWNHDPTKNYVAIPFELASSMPIITRGIAKDAVRNYGLRTCIDLKPWEGEEQYIKIHQFGGCWSYIGWAYYGGQDLSIGSGCNSQTGTFQHEFMHALGIFHEQSRPDRDDYVSINLTYVDPGYHGNFAKYTFDEVSIEDVPYDYESVMHYGPTGFVNPPGDTSIDPKIPYFADVIGQRKDFSRNDVQKINHMYGCSEPLLNSFSCDFTELNWCGFVNEPIDDPDLAAQLNRIEWKQWDVTKNVVIGDRTHQGETNGELSERELNFPNSDQSDGREHVGRYLALNGSYFADNDNGQREGVLTSRQFTTKVEKQCLEIWSNIHSSESPPEIKVELWESDDRYGDVIGRFPYHTFNIQNERDGVWQINRWNIQAPERFKLVISSKLSTNDDVVAVDDISILDRECESHRWPIYNFQETYDNTAHGEYIESDLMTASTGHQFVLRFYPRGHPNRDDERYASLFLHLHESSNALDLEWPWEKQFLKFIVQDQISDAVNRMDQNRVRATELSEEEPQKWFPIADADESGASVADSVIGYETFIPTFDIFNSSYSYVKHDMFMIFVEVRDMRDEDMSSKLDLCGDLECSGRGKSCLPNPENQYDYRCTCHYPFKEVWNGDRFTCECPEGYENNPNAENEEIERLSCFSLCDFAETNPCGEGFECKQESTGAVCVEIVEQPEWSPPDPKPTPSKTRAGVKSDEYNYEYDIDDEESFTSTDLALAVILTFLTTAVLSALVGLCLNVRRKSAQTNAFIFASEDKIQTHGFPVQTEMKTFSM